MTPGGDDVFVLVRYPCIRKTRTLPQVLRAARGAYAQQLHDLQAEQVCLTPTSHTLNPEP